MTNYLLIAYRPNGFESCRGHVTDRTDSDFQITETQDENEIVQAWAGFLLENEVSESCYCSYEITVAINGIVGGGEDHWELHDQLDGRAQTRAKELVVEYRRKQEEAKVAAEAQRRAAAEAHERAMLAKLKEKYDG